MADISDTGVRECTPGHGMKSLFAVVIGSLCITLSVASSTAAQLPERTPQAGEDVHSTLYMQLAPRLVVQWPAIADTRVLLDDAEHRATLGIPELLWASLPHVDSVMVETAFGEHEGTTLRVTLAGAEPAFVTQPLLEQVELVAAADVRHLLVNHADRSQTVWLWNGALESPPSLVPFHGFELCPALERSPDIALLLCARLTVPEAPQGIVWLEVRLHNTIGFTLGLRLDPPAAVAETERQLRFLLSYENDANTAALAFLGLQSIQERVVVNSQDGLVTMEVLLAPNETERLTRFLYEALASEVR